MVTNDGLVKVLDFGLAKLSEPPPGELECTATAQGLTAGDAVVGTASALSRDGMTHMSISIVARGYPWAAIA